MEQMHKRGKDSSYKYPPICSFSLLFKQKANPDKIRKATMQQNILIIIIIFFTSISMKHPNTHLHYLKKNNVNKMHAMMSVYLTVFMDLPWCKLYKLIKIHTPVPTCVVKENYQLLNKNNARSFLLLSKCCSCFRKQIQMRLQ